MENSIKMDETGLEIKGKIANKIFIEYTKTCLKQSFDFFEKNNREPTKKEIKLICNKVMKELKIKYTKK